MISFDSMPFTERDTTCAVLEMLEKFMFKNVSQDGYFHKEVFSKLKIFLKGNCRRTFPFARGDPHENQPGRIVKN